jgi:predicted restriction endonuclease
LQDDAKKNQDSLRLIASKVDVGTLIGSSGLKGFLEQESNNLAKIATIIMQTNSVAKEQADKYGITPELAQKVIPAITKVASVALSDSNKLTEVYNELIASGAKLPAITAEQEKQEKINKKGLDKEKVAALEAKDEELKKQKNAVFSEMIGSVTKLALNDELLNSAKENVTQLLDNNQKAITGVITHNLSELQKETARRIEARAVKGADLTKLEEPSLVGQVLTGVSPAFAQNTAKAITGLASAVLKETSNEQIRNLAASGQAFLTASKEEKPQVIAKIAEQGVAIISNPNIVKSVAEVGRLLTTEKDQIQKVVDNALKTEPVKKQLEEFGVAPQIVQSLVPLATQVGAALLTEDNLKKIPEVYGAFAKFTESTSQEKAEKEAQKGVDRSKLSKDEVKALDEKNQKLKNQSNAALSGLIGAATGIALQDNVLNSVRSNVPALLDNNQAAISAAVTHNLGKDGQVLAGVNTEFVSNTVNTVSGLASAVLKETSNEQIRGLAAKGQEFLTASKDQKPKVIAEIAEQGMEIIRNPNIIESVAKVGELLATEKEQVQKVVDNVLKTEPVKKQLEEFGVAPQIVQSLVPLATQVGAALLTEDNLKKIPKIYNAFNEFTTSEKEQKDTALSKLIGTATDIVLQDEVLSSLRNNIPALLQVNNQAAISAAVTHNLGKDGQVLAGVSPAFAQNTTKAVTKLVSTILKETSNDQIRDLAASGQAFLSASKDQKPKVIAEIAEQGMEIIRNPNIIESVTKVGGMLTTEKDQIQKVVDNALKTEPVKKQLEKFGVAPQMVQSLVPMATQVGAVLLTEDNLKKIPEVYNAFNEFTTSEKEQKNAALSGLIGAATGIALQDNVLNSVRSNVPALLDNNQAAITGTILHNLGKLHEESLPRKVLAGVSPAFAENTTKAVTGLVSTVLKETSNDQIRDLAASGQKFLTASKEEKPQVIQGLIGQGAAILANPEIAKSLAAVGTTLVGSNADISKMINNTIATTELNEFGITKEQVQGVVPIVTNVAAAVLNSTQDIANIVTKSQGLLASLDKTTQGLTPKQAGSVVMILDSLNKIAGQPGISNTLQKDLPVFLTQNKDAIPVIASNIVKNTPELKKLASDIGVTEELIKDTAKLGTDLLISAAPMVDKLAKIKLNEKDKDKYPPTKDQLVTIISDVRDLANMSTDDLKKPKGKEVLNKVISGVITFKNSHDDLGKIIDEDLPKLLLLKENQEQLAKVIDGVIATKAGPGLKLKTEKIIGIAAKNLPTVTELADLYSQGRYAAMFPKIVKLAFQKEVLSTAISTYFTVRKYKAEGKKDVKVENVLPEAAKNVQPELPANDKKTELQGQVANIVQAQGVKKHFVLKSEGSEGSKSGEKTKESIKKEMGEYVSPPNKSTPTPVISPKKHEQLKLQGPGKN